MKLEVIKELLGLILIDILANEKNGFEKKEYFIVCRLLHAIKNYPLLRIPSTRIGLLMDYSSYVEEYVIRFQDDTLWIGMDGIERTAMGSDSYQKESLNFSHSSDVKLFNSNQDFEFDDISSWYKEAMETLSSDECKITLECYDPEYSCEI